ncbi:PepSY domain-containing protein [Shewanella waksmanii]|uniref:PepSY domain-containing protein n=1 Tax=Shewanella waksmanii TaxID=213783 RepID=UPI003736D0AC
MKKSLSVITLVCVLLSYSSLSNAQLNAGISLYGNNKPPANQKAKPPRSNQLVVKSRNQAISMAKSQYAAKVLNAQPTQINGNPGYRVKLLNNDGRVFYVNIDARTGRMSR